MSETRMAGDKLQKYGKLGERFGDDYVDRVKARGLQDDTKQGASRKELTAEFRYGRDKGQTISDLAAEYQGKVDSGEYRGNSKAQEYLEMHGVNFGGGGGDKPDPHLHQLQKLKHQERSIDVDMGTSPTQTINPGNPGEVGGGGGPGPGIDNSTNVNVNQDNDITNNVSGSGNTISNNQDNSVNTTGGNVQSYSGRYGSTGSMFKDNWMQNFFS